MAKSVTFVTRVQGCQSMQGTVVWLDWRLKIGCGGGDGVRESQYDDGDALHYCFGRFK